MFRPLIFGCGLSMMACTVSAAPVATECSCDPAAVSGTLSVDRGASPGSCLLVSKPDGSACQMFVDSDLGSKRHDELIETFYPLLRSYLERRPLGSSLMVEDNGFPGENPDSATRARSAARTKAIAELLGSRVFALMANGGPEAKTAFQTFVPEGRALLDRCRALALSDILAIEYLEFSLPPYEMVFQREFGCHTTQSANYLTIAVREEDQLYRFMVSKTWFRD